MKKSLLIALMTPFVFASEEKPLTAFVDFSDQKGSADGVPCVHIGTPSLKSFEIVAGEQALLTLKLSEVSHNANFGDNDPVAFLPAASLASHEIIKAAFEETGEAVYGDSVGRHYEEGENVLIMEFSALKADTTYTISILGGRIHGIAAYSPNFIGLSMAASDPSKLVGEVEYTSHGSADAASLYNSFVMHCWTFRTAAQLPQDFKMNFGFINGTINAMRIDASPVTPTPSPQVQEAQAQP